MKQKSRLFFLIAALVMGLCFHVSAVQAKTNTPESVVKNFADAYFMLDRSMAVHLSEEARINENEVDKVDLFLLDKAETARRQGYELNYFKMKPLLMKTRVLSEDDTSATVEFKAVMIRSVNPLYRIVGYLFGLLEEHEVLATVDVVLEDGLWKIGPGAFSMPN